MHHSVCSCRRWHRLGEIASSDARGVPGPDKAAAAAGTKMENPSDLDSILEALLLLTTMTSMSKPRLGSMLAMVESSAQTATQLEPWRDPRTDCSLQRPEYECYG